MRLPAEYLQLAYRRALLMAAAELMQREYLGDMNERPRELSSDMVLAALAQVPDEAIYEFIAELEADAERAASELGKFTLIKQGEEHEQGKTEKAAKAQKKPRRKAAARKAPASRRKKPNGR